MSNAADSTHLDRRTLILTLAGATASMSLPVWARDDDGPAPAGTVVAYKPGNFSFVAGGPNAPFSSGVIAAEGYMMTRVRLRGTPLLADGLKAAAAWLKAQKRPLSALAACELRSAAPLGRAEFAASNQEYNDLLRANGFGAKNEVPLARSNMALQFSPPSAKSLYAFTYTVPLERGIKSRDFVISGATPRAGSGDAAGADPAAQLKAKTASVIDVLRGKVEQLGGRWEDINGAQIYTLLTLDPAIEVLNACGLGRVGLDLFPGHPPGAAADFEMDVRAISIERDV